MSLSVLRPWPAAPLASASHESRRQLELLLFRLTLAVAPLLLVTLLLVPSQAPLAALLSLFLIPLYGILAAGALRFRPSLLLRPWFGLLLFALQAALIFVQVSAYDRPGSPLWLAFLPGVLAAAARWELPGVALSLAWFALDRLVAVLGFSGLSTGRCVQELTLELAVMSVTGVIFGFLFRELEVHRQRLRASTESLTAVLENVGEAILTVDARGMVSAANLAAGDLFRSDPAALIGQRIGELLPAYSTALHDLARHPGRSQRHDARGIRRDGSGFTAEVVTSHIVGDGGPVNILVLRDITELRARTAALSHQALHDSLTGLPNRRQLTEALADRVRLARRNAAPLSILIMDLDSFKEVNDSRGHQVGDLLLQAVARRLTAQLRDGDLVARLGGDEFAILPAPSAAPGCATVIAEKIVRALRKPFPIEEAVIETRVSIGIASFPEHGEEADALMRHADAAMYAAKRAGGGWATAVPGRQEDRPIIEATVTSADLRRAVEDGELILHCVAVMGLDGNTLRGVDARVRWHHPDLGILEPSQFIPLAERNGVIRPLIRCAARLAAEQMAAWRRVGSEVPVSMAIPERSLRDPELVSNIAGLLDEHGLPRDSLTLLTTQDTALAPTASAFFAAGSEVGLRLAIDDYGAGAVSLLHLHTMGFTEVRLATSLTSCLGSGAADRAVVQAIIAMAHALEMTVTAKGVGDQPTLTLLRELGCDAVSFLRWNQSLPSDAPAAAIDVAALHAALTGSPSMQSDPGLVSAPASIGGD